MRFVDLTGRRFGRLSVTVVADSKGNHGETYYVCQCDCAAFVTVCAGNLRWQLRAG